MGLCMIGKIALNRVLGPRSLGGSFLIETALLQAIA